jgi:2-C-methyl-D-erythritol 4-phosphate cytidylyltransferase
MTADPTSAGLIVVAAGVGSRLGASVHKALVGLDGQPLVMRTLLHLLEVTALDPVVLVGHEDDHRELTDLIAGLPRPVRLVDGGARRQDSVAAGLDAVGDVDIVLVHDAARLFVPLDALPALIAAAAQTDCALLAVPVADTLKAAGEDGLVDRTVPRDGLWAAQTPQAFRTAILRDLLAEADQNGRTVTDEASLFEHAGRAVRIVEGSRINFKITTAEDLALAGALLAREEEEREGT